MKNFILTAQFLSLLGSLAAESLSHYFLYQEQKALEEDLHNLERQVATTQCTSPSIYQDLQSMTERMYNVSRIATTLIKGLQLDLTVQEALDIGSSVDWMSVVPNDERSNPNNWDFHFEYSLASDKTALEATILAKWRHLTNRALQWKARKDTWPSLITSYVGRSFSTRSVVMQSWMNDLENFLRQKLDRLLAESLDIGFQKNWMNAVFNASMIGKQLLGKSPSVIPIEDLTLAIQPLGWSFTDPTNRADVWDKRLVMNPELVERSIRHGMSLHGFQMVKDILEKWVAFTNGVMYWRKRELEVSRGLYV